MTALINGFNAVAANVAVILFPAALDVFLWLGPRLKADTLLAPLMEILPDIQSQVPASQARMITQFITDFYNGANLFSVLRTFPMGVFSLLSTNISPTAPFGNRLALALPGWIIAFGIMLVLTFLGWQAGSLYFRSVSRVALKLPKSPGLARSLLQGSLLSLTWMMLFTASYLPLGILLWILAFLGPLLRTILVVILSVPAVWIILGIYYSFYGIFTGEMNIFSSTRNSFRMLRYGLPPLGWFTLLTLLIGQGMDMLWRAAPANSWMMGIGIFGHAFVSTSLLAASFIYYRDLDLWIATALQWLKNNQNRSSARA